MSEREITHLVPPRDMADGEPPRVRIRLGGTVRRTSYVWSLAVVDLLQHVERDGFDGAPRAAASSTRPNSRSPGSRNTRSPSSSP